MARMLGQEVALQRLENTIFWLADGDPVSPIFIELTRAEMTELSQSGKADALLEKYVPVYLPESESFTFKIRTNKSRMEWRRAQRYNRMRAENNK